MSASDDTPWYADGLRFRCTACGQCCTGEPGHVWATKDELKAMAKARGVSLHVFKQRFVRRVGKRFSLKEHENGDCVMLKGGKCTVYRAKPQRCTTFPFWEDVMNDRREWEETKQRCEGIDQGDLYSREEIEVLLTGDTSPLEQKHARPPETRVVSSVNPDYPPPDEPDWSRAFEALEALYEDVARQLPRYEFTCSASGNCCDFDAYGHRLYATTLEAEYFFRHETTQHVNDDPQQCPAWGSDRLCKAREGRLLGCRTYFCPPYPNGTPEELHEGYMGKLKSIHERFGIEYQYMDVRAWRDERRQKPGPTDGGAAPRVT